MPEGPQNLTGSLEKGGKGARGPRGGAPRFRGHSLQGERVFSELRTRAARCPQEEALGGPSGLRPHAAPLSSDGGGEDLSLHTF